MGDEMELELNYSQDGDIRIAGAANIHTVGTLYEGLKAALRTIDPETGVRLDLSGVAELDTAAVQTLIAFRRAVGSDRVTVLADEKTRSETKVLGLDEALLS